MAEYCAWRARVFAVPDAPTDELREMAQTNFVREFGGELQAFELPAERPTLCDNRMAPHFWLAMDDGSPVKLDAALHGDDHFFPGPCDIAWDLAGLAVEWQLPPTARELLLSEYRRLSGDNAARRLSTYEVAYAIFRLAWSKMAAASVAGSEEAMRLSREARRYRRTVQRLTGCRTPQLQRPPAAARLPRAPGTSAAPELL